MEFELFKWSVAVASVIGVVANIHRRRWCFHIWAVTNASWTAVDVWHGVWAQAALQGLYFFLAIYGIVKWKRQHGKDSANESDHESQK